MAEKRVSVRLAVIGGEKPKQQQGARVLPGGRRDQIRPLARVRR